MCIPILSCISLAVAITAITHIINVLLLIYFVIILSLCSVSSWLQLFAQLLLNSVYDMLVIAARIIALPVVQLGYAEMKT